jgi:hypothetical protein
VVYLLDANILITASNTYYAHDRVPEFWTWLQHKGTSGNIKVPLEVYEEILEGRKKDDPLLDWVKNDTAKASLLLEERCDPDKVRRVVRDGYSNDLTDDEIEKLGRDPFLISYGLDQPDRCIVTTEVSKPSRERHNRHIPDVCTTLRVNCCGPWDLNKALGFKTGWKG